MAFVCIERSSGVVTGSIQRTQSLKARTSPQAKASLLRSNSLTLTEHPPPDDDTRLHTNGCNPLITQNTHSTHVSYCIYCFSSQIILYHAKNFLASSNKIKLSFFFKLLTCWSGKTYSYCQLNLQNHCMISFNFCPATLIRAFKQILSKIICHWKWMILVGGECSFSRLVK